MGNHSEKPTNYPINSFPPKQTYTPPLPQIEKDLAIESELIDAIKKRDVILFKKSLFNLNVKPTDIVGPPEQGKTVLHKLAESNFSEGMKLILDLLSSQKPEILSKVLNVRDIDGNTPLLLCCLANSVETLEVLARNGYVDFEAKNAAMKTALEIAIEMESPCVNVLTSLTSGSLTSTKGTLKGGGSDSSSHIQSLGETWGASNTDKDFESLPGSQGSIPSKKDSRDLKELKDPLAAGFSVRLPQVLEDLDAKETNFVDCEFPHDIFSLEPEERKDFLLERYPHIQWKRPSEFTGFGDNKNITLFNNFSLANISNSPLIGCEIYSAIAAIAEFPQRLSRMFITKELNKYGVCAIKFTLAGRPVEILLDDYFPCMNDIFPLYATPEDSELWFLFLEKAFAKLYGGYGELAKVEASDALQILTGMPVIQILFQKATEDKIWTKLVEYDKKNFILCAGEAQKPSNSYRNRIFSIVNLFEFNEFRLLKIRNHFGHFSWKGDFSINSPMWTKELKEFVGFSIADQSTFFMSIKDFIKEFDFLIVGFYRDNWIMNNLNVTSDPKHFNYFELIVERDIEAYISVHQKQPEFVDEGPNYNISPVEIILARDMDGAYMENIAFGELNSFLGKPTVYAEDGLESKLKTGRYVLAIKVKWVDEKKHDFLLNVFAPISLKLVQIDSKTCTDFLEKVYLSAGMASKSKFDMTNECEFASGWAGSRLWIFASNKGTKNWSLEIVFDRMQNLKIPKRFQSRPNSIKLAIGPSQKAVAFASRTNAGTVAIAWRFIQSWQ